MKRLRQLEVSYHDHETVGTCHGAVRQASPEQWPPTAEDDAWAGSPRPDTLPVACTEIRFDIGVHVEGVHDDTWPYLYWDQLARRKAPHENQGRSQFYV